MKKLTRIYYLKSQIQDLENQKKIFFIKYMNNPNEKTKNDIVELEKSINNCRLLQLEC